MTTRPRMTRHQREVYDRLRRRSTWQRQQGVYAWVPLGDIGSKGGLDHLVAKGYVQHQEVEGPRGGRYHFYRPNPIVPKEAA